MERLVQCPVCKKRFLKAGLRNHVINCAKAEAFIHLWNMLKSSKNKPYQFSPMVLRRQAIHLNYMLKNYQLTNKKQLQV